MLIPCSCVGMILYTVSWSVVISLPFQILFIVTCGAIFLAYVVSALKHCYVEVKNRNSMTMS